MIAAVGHLNVLLLFGVLNNCKHFIKNAVSHIIRVLKECH
jgi:hypothetical protein